MTQLFMIEIFAGTAVLCSVSKQLGLQNSIAVDKERKRGARSSIFQLDLTQPKDRALLEEWMQSPLLLWIHLAPVCGTASRARNIRRFHNDPKPLRSNTDPHGLPGLSQRDQTRVDIANNLFCYACRVFELAHSLGVLVTMENPSNSFFWMTQWVLDLENKIQTYKADFQVCMFGGGRDKWTKMLGNFSAIQSMSVRCDNSHTHAPWGFAYDEEGRQVWATSLESRYPTKMCVVLASIVLKVAEDNGLQLKPSSLDQSSDNPLAAMQDVQRSAGKQPRPSKIPPIVPDFSSVAVFLANTAADISCRLMSKLSDPLQLHTCEGVPQLVPKFSRFLRIEPWSSDSQGGASSTGQPDQVVDDQVVDQGFESCLEEGPSQKRFKVSAEVPLGKGPSHDLSAFRFKVAFGLPWEWKDFVARAGKSDHPFLQSMGVPDDLKAAVDAHVTWSAEQLSKYRTDWCRRWVLRAKALDDLEREDARSRSPHIAEVTKGKRILLMQEMLQEIEYDDIQALQILRQGSTLAGEVEKSDIFQSQYKPCLMTMNQLCQDAHRRNQLILQLTKSSGDVTLDEQMLNETELELEKGWAEGPFDLQDLEEGATISRRFALSQGQKVRMIDDFSISGVNDSCIIHNKIDLHLVDTFVATVRHFFAEASGAGVSTALVAKTYDLKSAYRQVPIKASHLKFAYFSVYNHKLGYPQIFRLKTLPFGATHSVYSFLRLSRMIYSIATRGLFLLTTNFYDDFILASPSCLQQSSKSGLELIFLLTGWTYATEGKKATTFDVKCKALGVEFDFSGAERAVLRIGNTDSRRAELLSMISGVLAKKHLDKPTSLVLRGKLGFADGFMHGRLGSLVLKKLSDHAYGRSAKINDELSVALQAISMRLEAGKPREVYAASQKKVFIYTDAAYEPSTKVGGLGGVFYAGDVQLVSWFRVALDYHVCKKLGADSKESLIYELELLAAVLALCLWSQDSCKAVQVQFGDNDSVRYSLIKASAAGAIGQLILNYQLRCEVACNSMTWFARVPTEANISDYPSRMLDHESLPSALQCVSQAEAELESILSFVEKGTSDYLGEARSAVPHFEKGAL